MNGVKIFQIHAGGFNFISKCFETLVSMILIMIMMTLKIDLKKKTIINADIIIHFTRIIKSIQSGLTVEI